ncbi:MAG TPA: hypothetical protein VLH39_07995 [Magnetospirillaceae bacterium]|nr:hypothetical protein [Magnetospirillaceae bacterium]
MTITARTRVYRSCWLASLSFAAAAALAAAGMGPDILSAAGQLQGLPISMAGPGLLGRHPVFFSIAAGVLCSAYGIVVLSILSFRYSRTVSMELFFFAFWALSLSAEVLRVESLRGALGGYAVLESSMITRFILCMRFLGMFSLFTGSLYSAGYSSEKHAVTIGGVFLVSLAMGTGLPVNTGTFGVDLLQRMGYPGLFRFLAVTCFLGSGANYLLAARITGEKGYYTAAAGCALIFAGGFMLQSAADPVSVILGPAGLAAGTAMFLRKIHSYYLWL